MSKPVEIRLSNVWIYLVGNLPEAVVKELQARLSFIVPGFKYTPTYKAMLEKAEEMDEEPEWDGTRTIARITQYGDIRVPSGLFSYIREFFNEKNIEYTIEERRLPNVVSSGWSTEGLILRDYQKESADKGLNRYRGVMKIATGGGKSETVTDMIIRAASFPAAFYVPSCDLLEQTYERLSKYIRYNGQPAKIGRIGGGHCDIQPITIATVQSAQLALTGKFTKYEFDDIDQDDETKFSAQQKEDIKTFVNEAQFVYNDECQHTSANTIQTVLNNSLKARFRYGGSASPWRDDGLDILIEACFGKKFCDIDASFLIRNNYLIAPYITFNHFSQHFGKTANFQSHYTKYIVENEPRNKWIAQRSKFHIDQGRPTIILVKWSKHAELLAELIPGSEILTSSGKNKRSPKKRKEILDLMRNGKLSCIIGTTLLDEGVDVPAATTGLMAGGGKSSTRALQRIGRLMRPDKLNPNKDAAYIEEFYDHTRYLDKHANRRRQIYSTEREFHIFDNNETVKL
jgi:superfamily II DNA or RNA helicase